MSRPSLTLPFSREVLFFIPPQPEMKSGHKIKTENIGFDEDDILLINQDEDYDDYRTPEASKVDETSFMVPDATEAASTLRLRQKLRRDKIVSLYRYLDVTGDLGLADLEQFNFKKSKNRQY